MYMLQSPKYNCSYLRSQKIEVRGQNLSDTKSFTNYQQLGTEKGQIIKIGAQFCRTDAVKN